MLYINKIKKGMIMKKEFESLSTSNKLLVISLTVEDWARNGIKYDNKINYPKDIDFTSPYETSRVFYMVAYHMVNKDSPMINDSVRNTITNKTVKAYANKYYFNQDDKKKLECLSFLFDYIDYDKTLNELDIIQSGKKYIDYKSISITLLNLSK